MGRSGAQGTFPYPSRDGGEGGEEWVHMATGVTYVTEKHSFLVKGTLTHLALCISEGFYVLFVEPIREIFPRTIAETR